MQLVHPQQADTLLGGSAEPVQMDEMERPMVPPGAGDMVVVVQEHLGPTQAQHLSADLQRE